MVRQRFDPPDPGRIIPIDQLAVCFSVQAMPLWVGIRPKWRLGLGRNMGLQNAHETWSVFSLSMGFFVAGKSIELTRGTFSKLCLMIHDEIHVR